VWRALIIIHRYLGIAVGLLMVMWFGSGVVMMYVGYPRASEAERIRTLTPIAWQACCHLARVPFRDDQQFTGVQVENVLGVPVLRLRRSPLPDELIDLAQGKASTFEMADARALVLDAAPRLLESGGALVAADTIARDQWTFGLDTGRGALYRFSFDDPAGSIVYVGGNGRLLLRTTRTQRLWNWFGAIPHWLYLAPLRANGPLWSQIVIWTSILGTILTLIGLGLGIVQFRRGKDRALSPYRGLFYWHHLSGLVFGIVTLTFVFSGLLSMNPWGLLESRRGAEAARITGPLPRWGEIRNSVAALAQRAPSAVSLSVRPLAGQLYWLATAADGTITRLDAAGRPAPLTEDDLDQAAVRLAGATGIATRRLVEREDTYYFSHHDQVVLPVYRVILNDPEQTRYYLDPVSGALLQRTDGTGRLHRWLFAGLHRLDFTAALRARPIWDIVMITVLLGGIALSCTGLYLAVRRVRADIAAAARFLGRKP